MMEKISAHQKYRACTIHKLMYVSQTTYTYLYERLRGPYYIPEYPKYSLGDVGHFCQFH